jgi:Ser-tRNA(Ala) deacylase AlaX
MANVKVTLKDGSVKEVAAGTTLLEVAKGLSQKLGKQALLAVVDGVNKDLTDKLEHDASVEFVVPESSEGLHAIRHTAAHIMAQAIQHLFPDTKFAIGPAIANGFYYDLDSEHVFVPEDLIAIEKEMAKIVKANLPLVRSELPRSEALKMFADKDEKYKVELINDLPEDAVISTYTQGDFTDLCAGPHCPSTGRVKAFKLQSIAGAYWRGDEKNKMLQRIYGTAFPSKEELDAYLHMLEEAARRDQFPVRLYAFSTLMRTPRASFGAVEPPYYSKIGPAIFRYSELCDSEDLIGLSLKDALTKKTLSTNLPKADLQDWLERRQKNLNINSKLTEMTRSNRFHFLAIGKDDNAPLSHTHMEARKLTQETYDLTQRTFQIIPGVDQLGLLLLTRAGN